MARVVTPAVLEAAQKGFNTAFQLGLTATTTMYTQLATVVNSNALEEVYGWLGDIPKLREWIGDRHVHGLSSKGYTIKNRKFELTIAVAKDDIVYDRLGLYTPRFQMMGNSAALHPDEVTFDLINAANALECYDGQNFFDTDHPVGKAPNIASVSNWGGGSGELWILADLSKPLKPFIFQKVGEYQFVPKEDPKTSDRVFMRDEFMYGTDVRAAAGFGFWQMAYGSKATLDAAALQAAFTAMKDFTDDEGRKLNIRPTHLIVGNGNVFKAKEILLSKELDGSTNTLQNLVQLIEAPMLN